MILAADVLSGAGSIVALCVAFGVILTGVFFASRARGTKEALTTLNESAAGMERSLKYERSERERDRRHCAQEIANLQGQVQAMQQQSLDALMAKVGDSVTELMGETLDRMDRAQTAVLDRLEDGLHAAVSTAVEQGVKAGVLAANEHLAANGEGKS